MKPFVQATLNPESLRRIRADMLARGHTRDEVEKAIEVAVGGLIFKNDVYQVGIRKAHMNRRGPWPRMAVLSIKRIDKQPVTDWREVQQIKNELIGPEHEGVQLFPAESRLVDSANQYFLFVVLDEKFRFPFGFVERLVDDISVAGSVQRPFEKPAETIAYDGGDADNLTIGERGQAVIDARKGASNEQATEGPGEPAAPAEGERAPQAGS